VLILLFAPCLRSSACHPHPPQPVSDESEEPSVEAVPSDEIASSVDGLHLLGIFGSGEVAGAIIRLDNGERQRMSVGDSVEGWILQSLEPRGALFEAATGSASVTSDGLFD
jgi:hypothetical protein